VEEEWRSEVWRGEGRREEEEAKREEEEAKREEEVEDEA
jgi:hypothetical protein